MHVRRAPRIAAGLLACLVAAACQGSAASPDPSDGQAEGFALRAMPAQPIPPEALFSWLPHVLISDDGTVVRQGPIPAIFPGPLLPNLQGAALSEAGYDMIVARAASLGLLDGSGDFLPAGGPLGSLTGTVELRVDGEHRTMTGDPNANIQCFTTPCDAAPGTPEAFGSFWLDLGNLEALVGDELGEQTAYRPEAFALLIGVEPPNDEGLGRQILPWPLDTPLADTGIAIGNAARPRCATVTGDDAATLAAAFAPANQLTMWIDEGADPADAVSLAVRPVLPGEDPCQEVFGVDG